MALNEQLRKKRGCEFSVRYVWNGAGARLRWNSLAPERPPSHNLNKILKMGLQIGVNLGIIGIIINESTGNFYRYFRRL